MVAVRGQPAGSWGSATFETHAVHKQKAFPEGGRARGGRGQGGGGGGGSEPACGTDTASIQPG